jgi:hypothetical protein
VPDIVERRQVNHENNCERERQALSSHPSLLSPKDVDGGRRFAQKSVHFMATGPFWE